jgi:hypothetical protein
VSKRSAASILAENLKRLMNQDANLESGPKLAKHSHTAAKTINNVLKERHDTQLSTIEGLAAAFGLEPYQILLPAEDESFLQIVYAYKKGGEQGRRLLKLAAETALHNSGPDETGRLDDDRASADRGVPRLHARIPK